MTKKNKFFSGYFSLNLLSQTYIGSKVGSEIEILQFLFETLFTKTLCF